MKLRWFWLKITIMLLAGWLLVYPVTLAQEPVTPTQAMQVANKEYEAGNYAEAAAIYEAILESGLAHSAVYYNLGNAYFKQGDLGRAILNYRRAQSLNPRDNDIAVNLSIARVQTVDKLEAPADEGLANLVQLAEEWLTLSEAMLLALVLWLLMGGLAVAALLRPAVRRWCGLGIGLLGIFLLAGVISMVNRSYREQNYPAGVIVAESIDVTSGPGTSEQYLVEFTLHAGAEVSLIESRAGWQRLSLPGDLQGWVPETAVEQVKG